MPHNFFLSIFAAMIFFACPVSAASLFPALEKSIPQAKKVGQATFSVLWQDVYDIAFYAPHGTWHKSKPHALSVKYHMAIDAEDIIGRSIEEMQRQNTQPEKLAIWKEKLRAFFPNVEKGTVLAALNIPGEKTVFYKDGQKVGTIHDAEFGPVYMGIWLAETTSEPEMRAELLGGS